MSSAIAPTPAAGLDRAVDALVDSKDRFARLSVAGRIDLLRALARDTFAAGPEQVAAACRAKGIALDSPASAEEWLGGPMTTLRNLRLLEATLQEIADHGRPVLPEQNVRETESGQVIARVFPREGVDRLLFTGFEAEIWMQPQVQRAGLADTMAQAYRGAPSDGKVALVLGAGNVASIGPMDVLYKLFVENQVCVLKMNPVNAYLGPYVERGFRAAIEAGYVRVVYGDAAEGERLVQHAGVDEIHITGSDRVHDLIVWGAGEEQQRRRSAHDPRLTKRITSELGCVTPVIIVPGEWTTQELAFQAQNVATMLANNGSFNCNAAKVLVTSASWPQRGAFLTQLRETLATIPPRMAYYPGAEERFERFTATYPQAVRVGAEGAGCLPWALATDLPPAAGQLAFGSEAWCSFLAETPLAAKDAAEFLAAAVDFCNETLWGTLSCTVLVDPRTARQASVRVALERAKAELRYGSVVINHWPAVSYGLCVTTWGAYPGHTLADIGSGIGVVHNTLMFEHPQKAVIQGPFTSKPKPPWFATHANAHRVARRLTGFEYRPSYLKVPGVALSALRG